MPDYDLKTALIKIKENRRNFALFKGEKDNHILITPQPPKTKQIEALEEECGEVKRIAKGICFYENGVLTFATKAPPAPIWESMTTKIFKAHNSAKFLPVVFRQLAEGESDEVSVIEEEEGEAQSGEVPEAPPIPGATTTPSATTTSTVPPGTKEESETAETEGEETADKEKEAAAKLVASVTKLGPQIKAAAVARPELREDFQRLVAEFKAKIQAGDLAAAKEALYELASLVKSVEAREEDTTQTEEGEFSKVAFEKIHLDWDARKQEVLASLEALHEAIIAQDQDAEAQTAASNLEKVLNRFNEGLGDKLDALRNADTPEKQKKLATEAGAIADHYLAYLDSDPLVLHVESNPYDIDVDVVGILAPPLEDLKEQIAPLMA
jgi:hypothetical protein